MGGQSIHAPVGLASQRRTSRRRVRRKGRRAHRRRSLCFIEQPPPTIMAGCLRRVADDLCVVFRGIIEPSENAARLDGPRRPLCFAPAVGGKAPRGSTQARVCIQAYRAARGGVALARALLPPTPLELEWDPFRGCNVCCRTCRLQAGRGLRSRRRGGVADRRRRALGGSY